MQQAWFSVVGLGADMIGVLILSLDWWLSHDQLKSETEFAAALKKVAQFGQHEPLRTTMQKWSRLITDRAHYLVGERRHWYWVGLKILLFGFILQCLGSWPGGFPALGVVP